MWFGAAVMLLGIVAGCAESGAVTGPPTLHPSAPTADIEVDMPTQCGVGSIACAGLWFDYAESGYWTCTGSTSAAGDFDVTATLWLSGDCEVTAGNQILPLDVGILWCTRANAHECADYTQLQGTCGYESNTVVGNTTHQAWKDGYHAQRSLTRSDHCEPASGHGSATETDTPTGDEEWAADLTGDPADAEVMCDRYEVYLQFSDGSRSASWYEWQCSDGTTLVER